MNENGFIGYANFICYYHTHGIVKKYQNEEEN